MTDQGKWLEQLETMKQGDVFRSFDDVTEGISRLLMEIQRCQKDWHRDHNTRSIDEAISIITQKQHSLIQPLMSAMRLYMEYQIEGGER